MSQQVKVCPKCGTENKIDNAACASCFTSLATVPTTLSDKPEPTFTPRAEAAPPPSPRVQTPASPVPPPGSEVTREVPIGNPMGGIPGGPIIPPVGTRPTAKRSSGAGAAIGWIVALLIIGGLAFGGWWFFLKPAGPQQAFQQMLDASKAKDVDKMMSLISKTDIGVFGGEANARRMMATPHFMPGDDPENPLTLGAVTYEGEDTALIEADSTGPGLQKLKSALGADYKIKFVMVREDGKWKYSGFQSGQRLGRDIVSAMRKMRGSGGLPSMPAGRSGVR